MDKIGMERQLVALPPETADEYVHATVDVGTEQLAIRLDGRIVEVFAYANS